MRHIGARLMMIILLFLPSIASAQTEIVTRPKIGYVFSGGGAKGMAHVGILKVFEEIGLQPDYITGTSMGSIIGALYAIGYSAAEIEELIVSVNWDEVLTNEIPSDYVMFQVKHEYNRFIIELPVYESGIGLPSGLIEGQKLSELFSGLIWPTAGINSFKDYPTPYLCIATDLIDGEFVELSSGDLASAIRASMSIPSVFTPVPTDVNQLLVDGGVLRNFPVSEAIDMGADIVIGAYVGFNSKTSQEELRSLTSIMARTSLLTGVQDKESQSELLDYLIIPDLHEYSPSSFNSAVDIIRIGEEAARAQIEILSALADSINSIQAPPQKRELPANDSLWITEIKVINQEGESDDFVIRKSGLEPDVWLTRDNLNDAIDRVFGTLYYDKIEYRFIKHNEGYQMLLKVKDKPKAFIKTAIHYDNLYGPGLILNWTRLNTFKKGSRLSITADISENPQFRAWNDLYLGKRRNFIFSLFATFENNELPYILNGHSVGNYFHDYFKTGAGLRQVFSINNQAGVDFFFRNSSLKLGESMKELYPEFRIIKKFLYRGPELAFFYNHNSFDNLLYPTSGSSISIRHQYAFNTRSIVTIESSDTLDLEDQKITLDPFWHLMGSVENYLPLGEKLSLNSELFIGVTSENRPLFDFNYIGGYRYNLRTRQIPLVGYQINEITSDNFLKLKLALQYEVIPNLYTSLLGNILFGSETIRELPENILTLSEESLNIGFGGGFTYKTPIGPVSVFLGSRPDDWKAIWYTSIGFSF